MSLRTWLKRLERESEDLRGGTLELPDGTRIPYEGDEMLEALLAAMEGRHHRLLPYLRQMPTNQGMPGVIKALERSEHAS